ncbi:MAG: alpha/beta hydrolase [Campylobacterota bacterium]|nr:alpha/beta hydrolase [Campylobacterota bacterium]
MKTENSRVLILYGWEGSPAPHWQNYLEKVLHKKGIAVCFPQLSNNYFPNLDVWLKEAANTFETFKPNIVVTHSLGNILWFHLCNRDLVTTLDKLILVAPPRDLSDYKDVKTFFPIKPPSNLYSKETILVTSTNDTYLNMGEAEELAEALHVEHIVLEKAGHINAVSGYGKWNWIVQEVLK